MLDVSVHRIYLLTDLRRAALRALLASLSCLALAAFADPKPEHLAVSLGFGGLVGVVSLLEFRGERSRAHHKTRLPLVVTLLAWLGFCALSAQVAFVRAFAFSGDPSDGVAGLQDWLQLCGEEPWLVVSAVFAALPFGLQANARVQQLGKPAKQASQSHRLRQIVRHSLSLRSETRECIETELVARENLRLF